MSAAESSLAVYPPKIVIDGKKLSLLEAQKLLLSLASQLGWQVSKKGTLGQFQ